MLAESAGLTMLGGRPITSRAGAMGLMQLMPATWREMRAALDLGTDPHGPRDNIAAGACYLRRMYDRFGYPGLFAAYNAGPERYADHLATRRQLPGETRAYLAMLVGNGAEPAAISHLITTRDDVLRPRSAIERRQRSAKVSVLTRTCSSRWVGTRRGDRLSILDCWRVGGSSRQGQA